MEKTALTQYLDWLAELKKCDPSLSSVLSLMEAKATELRDTVEKGQLINFHIEVIKRGLIREGEAKWSDGYLPKITEEATDFYNQTYKP